MLQLCKIVKQYGYKSKMSWPKAKSLLPVHATSRFYLSGRSFGIVCFAGGFECNIRQTGDKRHTDRQTTLRRNLCIIGLHNKFLPTPHPFNVLFLK